MTVEIDRYEQSPSKREPSPESLLNVPLVRHALSDPQFRIVQRRLDHSWTYERPPWGLPSGVGGFNPARLEMYVGATSYFSAWIGKAAASARPHNPRDHLVREVLLLVHDYLHCWAYQAINELRPELGLGMAPITKDSIEDLAFGHLLTEAAAVAGMDYWYLSTICLNDVCRIDTEVLTMAVPYREEKLEVYRRFLPGLTVQSPAFFAKLARTYCTGGDFFGMTASTEELATSPLAFSWIAKEMSYGDLQREYTRAWLAHLAEENIAYSAAELRRPLKTDRPWMKALMDQLGELLWDKVKNGSLHRFSGNLDPERSWRSSHRGVIDFRYVNWSALSEGEQNAVVGAELSDTSFSYLFHQFISGFERLPFDREMLKLFDFVSRKKDIGLMRSVFGSQKTVESGEAGPRDLFFPG